MVENDIKNTSRPWVEIKFGPVDKTPLYKISTNQAETGSYDENGKFIADGSGLITGANIGGVVPMDRHGTINIKDIAGIWPNRISDIGRYSADMSKGPGPNMSIEFGWQGLNPKNDYSNGSSHTNKLTAFIQGVKFDIGEDAAITIEIEFVAYSSIVFSDIMAFDWNDIGKSDPDKFWDVMIGVCDGKEPTAIDVISYVTSADFSYSLSLNQRKTIIECRSTGFNCVPLKSDNDLTSIEFAMPLSTWLNSMLAKIVPTQEDQEKAEKDGIILTYERKNDEEFYEKGVLWTKIIYDWVAQPDPQNKDVDEEKVINDYTLFMKERDSRAKKTNGPVLYWKSGQESYSFVEREAKVVTTDYIGNTLGTVLVTKKRVLNWQSDLSTYTQLFRMFKDELMEKYNELKQEDNFEDFIKGLEKYGSVEELQAALNKKPGAFGRILDNVIKSRKKERDSLISTVGDASDISSNLMQGNSMTSPANKDQTMSALLAANSFKVTAEVMGDPDFGTLFQGMETIITTDFKFGGEEGYLRRVVDKNGNEIDVRRESIVDMFSRQWILMNSEHNFGEDGTYTTKIELQGYIPLSTSEKAEDFLRKSHSRY